MAVSLGDKIRLFRKRAEMSQIDLELEAGMASGALSRIEQGIVNPSKETILTLGSILKLNGNELADLFEIRPLYPTQTEVEEAIDEIKERFNREDVFSYLIDEWVNMHAVSKGFIKVLGLDGYMDRILGKSLVELVFDHDIPIRQHLDPDYVGNTLATELARLPNLEESELFQRLSRIPEFMAFYEQAKNIAPTEIIGHDNKTVHFVLDGQKLRMSFGRDKLKSNPRFEVIEYFNPQPY